MTHTNHDVSEAIRWMERVLDAARNSNHAGEVAAVSAYRQAINAYCAKHPPVDRDADPTDTRETQARWEREHSTQLGRL